jgi:hypothetical protein
MAQDQAVIGWLATRPALPDLTRDLLIDVLIFWEPLAPLPVVTATPASDADADELLHAVARRLLSHPCHPDDQPTQMVLADLRCLVGLAWYSLLDPDGACAGRRRWEQHLDWVPQLRVLETDTAVDLALADLRRERGQYRRLVHRSPAPGRAPPASATGTGPAAQRTVWAPEP